LYARACGHWWQNSHTPLQMPPSRGAFRAMKNEFLRMWPIRNRTGNLPSLWTDTWPPNSTGILAKGD
jgi:hypothetical protein